MKFSNLEFNLIMSILILNQICIMNKIKILFKALLGELIKLYYRIIPWSFSYGLNRSEIRKEKVIISLTSYGRRVKSVLPFTIISLLKQTYKPDKIILWLNENYWNNENLPISLLKLKKYGLEVCFCNDIKSYKKLIPTLNAYPNDVIITVDDDVYYRRDVVKLLIEAYRQDPSRIYTHRAHQILLSETGQLKPYNDWIMNISGSIGRSVFPTGVGGCLYKRSLLYSDICKENLFMKLSPKADDVWFYFMEVLQHTQCAVLPYRGIMFIPLDALYQYFHANSSLSASNCKDSQNDVQIRNVMAHYHLNDHDLVC